ncbi:urea transporter [Sphingobacterium rhinopitheci]|uniref:urea transporter n=1 Tax=Sphingobacterium rhinopitheci TaxID=2781960 RepID=UPI001F51FB07|nr:urea transporter [Sphingobacterium rhinopitheci]MCI0922644.1 urea transporter [Sphingobacterium rhinopitheci]
MKESIHISPSRSTDIVSVGFLKMLLRGSGQVMFQNNVWTGALFLVGIFVGSYMEGQSLVAYGAVVGLLVSTLTGYFLPITEDDGDAGLWGFNGILVGCAFFTFMGNSAFTWLALILCSMTTTWVRIGFNNLLAPFGVNSLTFPFVFMTWIFLFSAREMQNLPGNFLSVPSLTVHLVPYNELSIVDLLKYWMQGISQVFLINSWITGLIFVIALFISNKWAGIWALIASAIALAFAIAFKTSETSVADGLYGFSATLTGIAIGMTFYQPNWKSAIWAVIAIIITVFIQAGMNALLLPYGIPSLTAPFCIATWLFLLPQFKFTTDN